MKLLAEVAAPVRMSVDHLRALIDGDRIAAMIGGGRLIRGPGMVGVQGGWWYRGEYTAEHRHSRVFLVHRVYNAAGRGSWAVPLANRMFIGHRAQWQHGVRNLARRIDDELGGTTVRG